MWCMRYVHISPYRYSAVQPDAYHNKDSTNDAKKWKKRRKQKITSDNHYVKCCCRRSLPLQWSWGFIFGWFSARSNKKIHTLFSVVVIKDLFWKKKWQQPNRTRTERNVYSMNWHLCEVGSRNLETIFFERTKKWHPISGWSLRTSNLIFEANCAPW